MDIAKIRKKSKEAGQNIQDTPTEREGRGETAEVVRSVPEDRNLPKEQKAAKALTEPQPEPGAQGATADESDETVELLTFRLAREEYSFKVSEIEEIIRPQRITKIPRTGEYLLGITSLRGKIMPVIDLKKMLGLKEDAGGDLRKQKILILKGPRGPLGVSIDRVVDIVAPPAGKILETPLHLPEEEKKFLEGVAQMDSRFIPIIRLEEVAFIW